MSIRDTTGEPITYLPLTLDAGEDSSPLVIQVDTPEEGQLKASKGSSRDEDGTVVVTDAIIVWARLAGTPDPYVNITDGGLDLSEYDGPLQEFEIIFTASGEVEDLPRVALTVGAISSGAAGWLA